MSDLGVTCAIVGLGIQVLQAVISLAQTEGWPQGTASKWGPAILLFTSAALLLYADTR